MKELSTHVRLLHQRNLLWRRSAKRILDRRRLLQYYWIRCVSTFILRNVIICFPCLKSFGFLFFNILIFYLFSFLITTRSFFRYLFGICLKLRLWPTMHQPYIIHTHRTLHVFPLDISLPLQQMWRSNRHRMSTILYHHMYSLFMSCTITALSKVSFTVKPALVRLFTCVYSQMYFLILFSFHQFRTVGTLLHFPRRWNNILSAVA